MLLWGKTKTGVKGMKVKRFFKYQNYNEGRFVDEDGNIPEILGSGNKMFPNVLFSKKEAHEMLEMLARHGMVGGRGVGLIRQDIEMSELPRTSEEFPGILVVR
jgi:hypothetical protein